MVVEHFQIQGIDRLKEFKHYLREQMPHASYEHTLNDAAGPGQFDVVIRYGIENALVLNRLHNKWKGEDLEIPASKGILSKLLSRFRISSA